MNVRFHLPENEKQYADQVLTVLLQAALPQAMAQLDAMLSEETSRTERESA